MEIQKNWTVQEAFEADQTSDPSVRGTRLGPLSKWYGMHKLEALKTDFLAGDKFSLLHAIRECARCDLPMPDWVATAYINAFDRVLNCHEKSWDAVFGTPLPKGANLNALRKKRLLQFSVWNEVRELVEKSKAVELGDKVKRSPLAIDDQLFEKVGAKFALGKTLAKEYYYAAKDVIKPDLQPKCRKSSKDRGKTKI